MELSAAAILGAEDLQRELVSVPEWNGDVWVSTMTGTARDEFEQEVQGFLGDELPIPNARARLLVRCLTNAAGAPLFALAEMEALGKKNGAVLDRLFDVAMRLSGLDKKTAEALKKN